MSLRSATFYSILVKLVWVFTYAASKTNEKTLSAKSLVNAGLVNGIAVGFTLLGVALLIVIDLSSNHDTSLGWISSIGFAVLTTWTNHYAFAGLLCIPPFVSTLIQALNFYLSPVQIHNHPPERCEFTGSKRRLLGDIKEQMEELNARMDSIKPHTGGNHASKPKA